jgi:hypothetical protein
LLEEGTVYQITHSLLKKEKEKTRKMFLFTDMLMWTSSSFEFRGEISLGNRSLSIVDVTKKSEEAKHEFEVTISSSSFVFGCESEKEKHEWIQAILEAANEVQS